MNRAVALSFSLKMSKKKLLVAADFDDTLIAANSDIYIRKLMPNNGKIPETIARMYSTSNWTKYMGAIFRHLCENGVTREQILRCMDEIAFVSGMKELLQFTSNRSCDVIIISDSNSVFIDRILQNAGLDKTIQKVYTNPAAFDSDDCLRIENYHDQDWCDLSTVNLCKGHILDAHIAEQKKIGVSYDSVAYVGDGGNDLCPTLRLKTGDVVFPRRGFKLIEKVAASKDRVHAKVVPWDTGFEILHRLEQML